MTGIYSDWIKEHFAAGSRELTPAPARHAACVLNAPVSSDPEVTRRCESALSDTELQRAERFAAENHRARFIQRRAFRRYCGGLALGSSQTLSQIEFNETEYGRPYLSELPDFWFSFSSCRFGLLGAWSSTHGIGVDIEDQTRDLRARELARHFFSSTEARAVEESGDLESLRTFFQFWSLKEAALKSIGEGLPFGTDTFVFELGPKLRVIQAPAERGGPERFDAHLIEGSDDCAAIVIRSLP